MKFLLVAVLFVAAEIAPGASRKLPDYIKPCKRDEPLILSQCMATAIDALRPHLINGIAEMNLPPVDPLHLNEINLNNDGVGGASLNIKAKLTNVTFHNGKEYAIKRFDVDLDANRWRSEIYLPNITMIANYRATGRLFGIPFAGEGIARGQFGGITVKGELVATRKTVGGREYFAFDGRNDRMDVDVATIKLRLGNLVRNREQLTQILNELIDRNAAELYPDLKPVVGDTLTVVFLAYMNGVHKRFAIDQLYPK